MDLDAEFAKHKAEADAQDEEFQKAAYIQKQKAQKAPDTSAKDRAYLAPSGGETFANSAFNSALGGLGHKAMAAMSAFNNEEGDTAPFAQRYGETLKRADKSDLIGEQEHPLQHLGGSLVGGASGMLIPAGGAATLGGAALKGAAMGAGYGALQGYGDSRNEGLDAAGDVGRGLLAGGVAGFGLGGAGHLVGKAGSSVTNYMREKVAGLKQRTIDSVAEKDAAVLSKPAAQEAAASGSVTPELKGGVENGFNSTQSRQMSANSREGGAIRNAQALLVEHANPESPIKLSSQELAEAQAVVAGKGGQAVGRGLPDVKAALANVRRAAGAPGEVTRAVPLEDIAGSRGEMPRALDPHTDSMPVPFGQRTIEDNYGFVPDSSFKGKEPPTDMFGPDVPSSRIFGSEDGPSSSYFAGRGKTQAHDTPMGGGVETAAGGSLSRRPSPLLDESKTVSGRPWGADSPPPFDPRMELQGRPKTAVDESQFILDENGQFKPEHDPGRVHDLPPAPDQVRNYMYQKALKSPNAPQSNILGNAMKEGAAGAAKGMQYGLWSGHGEHGAIVNGAFSALKGAAAGMSDPQKVNALNRVLSLTSNPATRARGYALQKMLAKESPELAAHLAAQDDRAP